MRRLRGAMRESFERGFLGIVETFFGIGEGKIRGNHQRALTNWPGNATLWAPGYSVLRNSAMATPSIARPMMATMVSDSPTGTTQPNQVTPGLRACIATGLTDRWLKTAVRIGSTM